MKLEEALAAMREGKVCWQLSEDAEWRIKDGVIERSSRVTKRWLPASTCPCADGWSVVEEKEPHVPLEVQRVKGAMAASDNGSLQHYLSADWLAMHDALRLGRALSDALFADRGSLSGVATAHWARFREALDGLGVRLEKEAAEASPKIEAPEKAHSAPLMTCQVCLKPIPQGTGSYMVGDGRTCPDCYTGPKALR